VPKPPAEVPIPEHGAGGGGSGAAGEVERELDKSFGYDRHFAAKYELGKEVGRGHFGHTCLARARKGDMRGQALAVKVISKAKVSPSVIPHSSFTFTQRTMFRVSIGLAPAEGHEPIICVKQLSSFRDPFSCDLIDHGLGVSLATRIQ